jgi:hypothetical protein
MQLKAKMWRMVTVFTIKPRQTADLYDATDSSAATTILS